MIRSFTSRRTVSSFSRSITTSASRLRPAATQPIPDPEDDALDYLETRGAGLERLERSGVQGRLGGDYKSYIKNKIEQHDLLHPSPFSTPVITPPNHTPGTAEELTRRALGQTGRRPLTDKHGRDHGYLRISLTERCNLRCTYCMPAAGLPLTPPTHILSNSEITHLASLFISQGVSKIRLTGGEPTLRKGLPELMKELGAMREKGLRIIGMTSNGLNLGGVRDGGEKLKELVLGGLTHLNLSLDTLNEDKFEQITRRKGHSSVLLALTHALTHLTDAPLTTSLKEFQPGLRSLKVNTVLTRSTNLSEMIDFVELTKEMDISVRFIEFMPFSGNEWDKREMVPYDECLRILREQYKGDLQMVDDTGGDGTSKRWRVKGYKGEIGFISSMSDHFCGTCNRLRITADGHLKVCLFDNTEVSLRDVLRSRQDSSPEEIDKLLVDVISLAVGNKKPKHAGMDLLKSMSNRSMVMIEEGIVLEENTVSHRLLRQAARVVSTNHTSRPSWRLGNKRNGSNMMRIRHEHTRATPSEDLSSPTLTHLDQSGRASMVSVASKTPTIRRAIAKGRIRLPTKAFTMLRQDPSGATWKKGDVFGTARIAGIMAGKKTSELIPLCHPIGLTDLKVSFRMDEDVGRQGAGWVAVRAMAECEGKTGVEMEALSAASVALLTVWDMVKAVAGKEMIVSDLMVTHKEGGKSGDWERPDGWVDGETPANEMEFKL